MTLLTGCVRDGSDHGACPPVVDYPAAVRERAATEIEAMPQESVVVGMMADYHVMRQQARACISPHAFDTDGRFKLLALIAASTSN